MQSPTLTSRPLQTDSSRFAWTDFRPLLLALLPLLAWDFTDLDLPLERLFGTAHGFAWQHHWLTAGVLYTGPRILDWAVMLLLLASIWKPLPVFRLASRRERIWWFATTSLCLIAIPLIRRQSATSCPWSLAEFGGEAARYVSHWSFGQFDGGSGRCFPSGHASTGFAFVAGAFALLRASPKAARAWLIGALIVGMAVATSQTVRGAHFLSHSLWTGWICWAITAVSFRATRAWRERGEPAAAAQEPSGVLTP
jgi:membrane-associated PAP2 superfamily phosphatase